MELAKLTLLLRTGVVENDNLGVKSLEPTAGLFLESEVTYPRLISLTETFLTLNPTLSPGMASWQIFSSELSVL